MPCTVMPIGSNFRAVDRIFQHVGSWARDFNHQPSISARWRALSDIGGCTPIASLLYSLDISLCLTLIPNSLKCVSFSLGSRVCGYWIWTKVGKIVSLIKECTLICSISQSQEHLRDSKRNLLCTGPSEVLKPSVGTLMALPQPYKTTSNISLV